MSSNYVHPEALVSTDWVTEHQKDRKVRIFEVDVDPAKGYEVGHIKGTVGWNWNTDPCDTTLRDLIDPRAFAELCRRSGINPDYTVVFYGDMNNWFAAWAFWQFKYLLGMSNVKNYDGSWTEWGNLVGAPMEKGEGSTAAGSPNCE